MIHRGPIDTHDELGSATIGRAANDTLYVSVNGNNSDGKTWNTAYNTIQSALDAASTDADDCTLIMIAPHATNYDINTTGDPTWTGNYILKGTHRLWAPIKNTHASATSVMKFTGKISLIDLAIFTTGSTNGVIFTKSGYRVRHCGFNSEGTTGANTSIHIDGTDAFIRGGIIENVIVQGNAAYTTGLYMDNAKINTTEHVHFHDCLNGIQVVHNDSDVNTFKDLDIGLCAIGLNLDAGGKHHIEHMNFHGCTVNIDDEVGDHVYQDLHGQFPITILPDNFTGVAVNTGDGADTWTAALVTVYTDSGPGPFRVIGVHMAPGTNEWYRLQFTADDGATYYDDLQFDVKRREGIAAPSGTEYIFNKGTVIKARSKSESAGVDNLNVWLEIQAI